MEIASGTCGFQKDVLYSVQTLQSLQGRHVGVKRLGCKPYMADVCLSSRPMNTAFAQSLVPASVLTITHQ